jgi:hypothetical protein
LPRAIVTATVVGGVDGQAVTIISDNLGHYKIPAWAKRSNAKKVVIECAKAGYRTVAQDRRVLRTMPKAPSRSTARCSRRRRQLNVHSKEARRSPSARLFSIPSEYICIPETLQASSRRRLTLLEVDIA